MSWLGEAWKVFKNTPRPVDYRDIVDRTGMSDEIAQKCICRLLKAKCIELAYGNRRRGRFYQAVAGVQPPEDQRGKSLRSRKARHLRSRASWPTSQITAGTKHGDYQRKNPLGGPAKVFRAIAERIEAGEPYEAVLADYGLRHVEEAT